LSPTNRESRMVTKEPAISTARWSTLYYVGVASLLLFEVANIYFIMPMPGSQRMNSLSLAYFLYDHRWFFRVAFGVAIVLGGMAVFRGSRKWVPVAAGLFTLVAIYLLNFKMAADHMFRQPENVTFAGREKNILSDSSLVICVKHGGEVKAYPIRYVVYHHQVQDEVGGLPLIITYCSVCRTGRVYEPRVRGRLEKFRLVGMDHFNAMFEDATTRSWWRQVNGEAVTGPLKGEVLPEYACEQLTIKKLFQLYPQAMVMQADEPSKSAYDSLAKFERGKSEGDLTRTDSSSWQEKSWVVGIQIGQASKAYDWNRLKKDRVIHDEVDGKPIVVLLSDDGQSFAAFARPSAADVFSINHDTLQLGASRFDFSGRSLTNPSQQLKKIPAFQEFWHSWRTFHPKTSRYGE